MILNSEGSLTTLMKSSISVGSPGGLRGYVGEGRLWGASFLRGCFPLGRPQSCGKNEAGVGTTSVGFLRKSILNASCRRETLGISGSLKCHLKAEKI